MSTYDEDTSGTLEFDEFRAAMLQVQLHTNEEVQHAIFSGVKIC